MVYVLVLFAFCAYIFLVWVELESTLKEALITQIYLKSSHLFRSIMLEIITLFYLILVSSECICQNCVEFLAVAHPLGAVSLPLKYQLIAANVRR